MFTAIVLIVLYLSMISQSSIVISSISVYADAAKESQQKSPTVWLIADHNTTTAKNNIINKTKIDANKTISDQYIITLKADVTRTPKGLQDALDNLTAKVESEGAKVIYVYKYSIEGLAIKVPNQQILEKLLNDLRMDSRIASIEPDKSVQAF
jgi:hypothetical protein